MTDKEKAIKELKEVLDNLDITSEYRLNLITAIEYLQEEPARCTGIGEPKEESGVLGEMIKEMDEEPKDHCEEPVSEELEDAAYKFVMDNFGNPKEPLYKFDQRCFWAGAKWQEEQMMKDAVESKVTITSKGILLEDLRIEDFDYEDKVKLVMV